MKKFLKGLGYVAVFTAIINLILFLVQKFTPIQMVSPMLMDPPQLVSVPAMLVGPFKIGNISIGINQTILSTWIVMILVIGLLFWMTRNMNVENPTKRQVILELLYNFIDDMFMSNFGRYKKTFASYFTAMFLFILFSNLVGFFLPFIPMFQKTGEHSYFVTQLLRSPTADPNTTVGLALLVVILFLASAFKTSGVWGYVKGLASPSPFLFPINIIGEFAKPINTSMRLFGNMFAGMIIMGLVYGLVIKISNFTLSFAVGWPAFLHLYFDMFSGVVQSFVFVVLSSVYISENLADKDEGYTEE